MSFAFADFVQRQIKGKILRSGQRSAIAKYGLFRLGRRTTKGSIIPGGKAEKQLEAWWDAYRKEEDLSSKIMLSIGGIEIEPISESELEFDYSPPKEDP